jgi:phosphatidylethanolamine-binding protein (PEBP) family uncharacterized protein
LIEGFSVTDLRAAMASHVLDEAELIGTYSLNPDSVAVVRRS